MRRADVTVRPNSLLVSYRLLVILRCAHCNVWLKKKCCHVFHISTCKNTFFKVSKKKLNFEKPKTPCFGRKVAATMRVGRGGVEGSLVWGSSYPLLPNPKLVWWEPERCGPEGWRLEGRGPEGGEPTISRFFSLSRSHFRSFSFSGGLLVEFWWCLKRRDPQVCTFGVLGLSCEAPDLQKTPKKIKREDPERERAKFWAVRRRRVQRRRSGAGVWRRGVRRMEFGGGGFCGGGVRRREAPAEEIKKK